jgi:hypothetical protein
MGAATNEIARTCESCGRAYTKRPGEDGWRFRHRRTCGRPDCVKKAKRAGLARGLRKERP